MECKKMNLFLSGEIDIEVDRAFSEVRKEIDSKLISLKDKDYGNELQSIGIIPIIVNLSPEYEEAGFFKERMLFKRKQKSADYRLRIDFGKFINGDYNTRRLLLAKNIIDSIRSLGTKAKKDFDAISLEKDILDLLEIDEKTINKVEIK
jgi:hypothetical protein